MSTAEDRIASVGAALDVVALRSVDAGEPLAAARLFLESRFAHADGCTLCYWRGDFYRWTSSFWELASTDWLRAQLYPWLEDRGGIPNKSMIDNVMDALRGVAFLEAEPPCWMESPVTVCRDLIACTNGLVNVETRDLLPPSTLFFNLNACGFQFRADPPPPAAWLAFLQSLWPDDVDSIACLQELFGLLLTADTSYQKIALLIGPKRSGKGTIARVLRALLGLKNVAAPTLAGLGQNFGLAGLIGKPLAIISDARLSGRSDLAIITENLLRISGEDAVSVPRKYREDWTGTLPTRFLMLTNELPMLTDSSGALASRFVILPMTQTFYGREDNTLTDRLLAELPGIFAWALDGLDRLKARGHLLHPAAGTEMLEHLDRLSSPIKAFVADCCVIEPAAEIACPNLYEAWSEWCAAQHRDHAGTLQIFSRNLHAAFPTITTRRPRLDGDRIRVFTGIRLLRSGELESGPQWSAAQSIAHDAREDGSKDLNDSDCGPARTTHADRIEVAAHVAGISADLLRRNLTPGDLDDPELDLLVYARTLAAEVRP